MTYANSASEQRKTGWTFWCISCAWEFFFAAHIIGCGFVHESKIGFPSLLGIKTGRRAMIDP